MDKLIDGYRRFRQDVWPDRKRLLESLADLGQAPRALVIACADSRVDPAMIFDAAPGELFVVRNIANLVPPYAPDAAYHGTSAALEFAVRVLRVPDIIVMGHGLCGGIRALLEGTPPEAADFVAPWIRIASRAKARVLECQAVEDVQLACEHEAVKLSLENLRGFPWIAERLAAGDLKLCGAHFDIRSGRLEFLDANGAFSPV